MRGYVEWLEELEYEDRPAGTIEEYEEWLADKILWGVSRENNE